MKHLDREGRVVRRPHAGMVGHPADEDYLYGEDDLLPLAPNLFEQEGLSEAEFEEIEALPDPWV